MKKYPFFLIVAITLSMFLLFCDSGEAPGQASKEITTAFRNGGCGACHVIPGIPNAQGMIGPDMSRMGEVAAERIQATDYQGEADSVTAYLRESVTDPDLYLPADCPTGPCQPGQMPAQLGDLLREEDLTLIVDYLAGLPQSAAALSESAEWEEYTGETPTLTEEEFAQAKQVFFDRCAGCHGVLRKGATGPALTPDQMLPNGTLVLSSIIFNGTPGRLVRNIPLLGSGSLFIKTHSNSRWIWTDHVLSPDEEIQRSVCVIDKEKPIQTHKCWQVADYGRAVHFEYNKEGTEVWVIVWGQADQPGQTGEIVIYDDALEEIARIPDLVIPTGKFNVITRCTIFTKRT